MERIFKSSAASENSANRDGHGAVVSRVVFEIVDEGSWTGALKVAARLQGRGRANTALTTYSKYLPIRRMEDDGFITNTTGATAAGLYYVDVAGLEYQFQHTRTTGSMSLYAKPVQG